MSVPIESLLASRLAGVEGEVGEPDWADVRRKARRLTVRRLAFRGAATALLALVAVLAVVPAFGGLGGRLVQVFENGQPASGRVVRDFSQLDAGAPPGMATGVIAAQTREVMDVDLSTGKAAVLRVAPTRSGGFCIDLSTNGRHAEGVGGCDRDRTLTFSPGLTVPAISPEGEIVKAPVVTFGHTLLPSAAEVEIRYQDGQVAHTPVVWVTAPIDAGFFVYEIPEQHWAVGHRPTILVLRDGREHELAREESQLDSVLGQLAQIKPNALGHDSGPPRPAQLRPSR